MSKDPGDWFRGVDECLGICENWRRPLNFLYLQVYLNWNLFQLLSES